MNEKTLVVAVIINKSRPSEETLMVVSASQEDAEIRRLASEQLSCKPSDVIVDTGRSKVVQIELGMLNDIVSGAYMSGVAFALRENVESAKATKATDTTDGER